MVRSVLSVLAGYATTALLVVGAHAGLASLLPSWFPLPGTGPIPAKAYILDLALGSLTALAGGYVTGWLSKRRPVRHGFALAALLLVLGGANSVLLRGSQPLLYLLALPLAGAAFATVGGWLRSETDSRAE